MPQFETYAPPGIGQYNLEHYAYVQAVRVGDAIHLAGQGGWDLESRVIHKEINAQIDQAFENVDFNLKFAGGKGWSQVYKVRSYHLPLNTEAMDAMVRNFKKWMPNHKPIWTCVQVGRLGEDDMRVEIEVEAHDPEGAKKPTTES
ncbi:hypothetical protein O1611_g7479 [Lasiodiplodia mahajangana]|uniref:Uncharacterized protein n=1 Tax=Lasiodiplodia mahajangana TaxID=1108764 RepID=A0ACC2JFH2_9PEZI|nr:hypothetical protein O1611_g7479 [Lasiodiplodia mahajangana]